MATKKSKRRTTTVRLEPRLWEATKIQAIREQRDASDLVEDALKLYFHHFQQPAT